MKDILDVIRVDVVKLSVYGSLRNDNNSLSFANLPMLNRQWRKLSCIKNDWAYARNGFAHFLLPYTSFHWLFRNENEIRSSTSRKTVKARAGDATCLLT